MKKGTDIQSLERRVFMKRAGLGVGAVGAAAIGLPKTSAAASPGGGAKLGSSGYRETKHVKTYYDLARY
jgi:hypothetical protein